jgi:hypothetical protein
VLPCSWAFYAAGVIKIAYELALLWSFCRIKPGPDQQQRLRQQQAPPEA